MRLSLKLTLVLAALSAEGARAEPAYLAYGDLRGHLEPCGCDPATDLGGIKRLGLAIERERAQHPQSLILDLGNNLPIKGESSLKTPFLIGASARIGPDAVLLNTLELQRLGEIRAWQSHETHTYPPYVLTNVRPQTAAAGAVRPSRSGKGWVVFGYAFNPDIASQTTAVNAELLAAWSRLLRPHVADNKILLFSGSDGDLQTFAKAKLFDAIVSSNASPMTAVPGVDERQDERRLVRYGDQAGTDMVVRMVPLGGQGLLRGGALQFDEAKPLASIVAGSTASPPETTWLKSPVYVTWLDTQMATADGPLKSLYDDYTKAARASFVRGSTQRLKDLKNTPFAGVQACGTCHPQQTQVYLQTAHAHAMATLQKKGKDEDAECVACHNVGANVPGGFVSVAATPQLANVQCENCHGPRLAHSRNPAGTKPLGSAAGICVTCHNQQHSSAFKFDVYWPRIQH